MHPSCCDRHHSLVQASHVTWLTSRHCFHPYFRLSLPTNHYLDSLKKTKAIMSETNKAIEPDPELRAALPSSSSCHKAFEEAHALYMRGDYESAYECAKKALVDPAITSPSQVQLALIMVQCSPKRQEHYKHVSRVTTGELFLTRTD
jgi:hypothetical protein